MEKPLNQLNRFFELAGERKLSGNDQLMYLHLWNAFNRSHYPATLQMTDAELLARMNQHDSSGKPLTTLKVVKARLKQKGFIDFKAGKGVTPTEYRLIRFCGEEPESRATSEVLKAWDECGGVTPNTFVAQELIRRAEEHGVEFMVSAIREARKANTYPRMNYLYFERFLEERQKGVGENVRRAGSGTEQYAGLLDEDVPAEYAVR